jgi:hypothetical protein
VNGDLQLLALDAPQVFPCGASPKRSMRTADSNAVMPSARPFKI